jgi:hypothetical protein
MLNFHCWCDVSRLELEHSDFFGELREWAFEQLVGGVAEKSEC